MATTPTQTLINNSTNPKPSARKLPIKRKTPPLPQPQPQPPSPIPNPTPTPSYDDYDNDDDDDDEFDEDDGYTTPTPTTGPIVPLVGGGGGGGGGCDVLKSPPFKFHRIWSESDEIRFLQGLLGCWSQGLVFPRDLNIFYDRFSESMPQPYTRSQLSEKLRRLRKKFRIMSTRIARGQDPERLAPHDRDLLHLCTRLWHPSHASTSPFSAPDSAAAATAGNKRRRPNPRVPPVPLAVEERKEEKEEEEEVVETVVEEKDNAVTEPEPRDSAPSGGESVGKGEEGIGFVGAKMVLDVFDEALKEVQMRLKGDGSSASELSRRWKEQKLAEIDVFVRRLRLVLEQSFRN